MTTLFDPLPAGDLRFANRIVMAPLTRNRAPGAVPNALMAEYYAQRATAGLIITEATADQPQGQGYADVPGLYSAEQLDGWKHVTDAVHAAGGKHRRAAVACRPHLARGPAARRRPPVAPSRHRGQDQDLADPRRRRQLRRRPRRRARCASRSCPASCEDYRHAARNAIDAGFDGVEIHGANGYLLDQFLRDGANQRTDAYGGSIENRARLLLEVVRRSREIGGRAAPASASRRSRRPTTSPTPTRSRCSTMWSRQLAPLGLAYVHLIEGATGGARELPDRPFDYDALRRVYRDAGGQAPGWSTTATTRALAVRRVARGADLVAFGRPFIANPDLVERLRERRAAEHARPGHLLRRRRRGLHRLPGAAGRLSSQNGFLTPTKAHEHPRATPRRVERLVAGQATSDGAGVKLTRVLTQDLQRRLDPFLMLDAFGTDNPDDYIAGFPDHPHRGFETVTYMLDGRMRHRDCAGHEGLLQNRRRAVDDRRPRRDPQRDARAGRRPDGRLPALAQPAGAATRCARPGTATSRAPRSPKCAPPKA